jgi:hypothetical protein
MTPKIRADKLFDDFLSILNGGQKYGWNNETAKQHREMAKKCALRCVEEIHKEDYLENPKFWDDVIKVLKQIPTII